MQRKIIFLTLLVALLGSPARGEAPPAFLLKWGSQGSGDGQFIKAPDGIAVHDGKVYVADQTRIQVFSTDGTYLAQWSPGGLGVAIAKNGAVYATTGLDVRKSTGSGMLLLSWDDFAASFGVALGVDGNLYVVDSLRDHVQKFTPDGSFLTQFGSTGEEDGQFLTPSYIAVGPDGSVYVSDYNQHVSKFTAAGVFVKRWGSFGTDDGQFKFPSGVATDSHGNIYVGELFGARVQKFTANGEFLTKWGSAGTGDGEFSSEALQGVAVDDDGNVYVVDSANYRVEKFGFPVVPVDVEPQACPNPLNVDARGVLPVAILGTADLDVTKIDPSSVRLAGVAPLRSAVADVATPFYPLTQKQNASDCTAAGPDGFVDLTLKFDRGALLAALGTVTDGEVRLLTLTGMLREEFGGTAIQGEDVVSILAKH